MAVGSLAAHRLGFGGQSLRLERRRQRLIKSRFVGGQRKRLLIRVAAEVEPRHALVTGADSEQRLNAQRIFARRTAEPFEREPDIAKRKLSGGQRDAIGWRARVCGCFADRANVELARPAAAARSKQRNRGQREPRAQWTCP